MTEIAANHQLYFYQLFRDSLGFGKQVRIAQVEELLVAEDVAPADVGARDAAELLDALSDFVKVSVFRRGRVMVTTLRNDELDEALERATERSAAKATPKGKPWKVRGSKVPVPTKPKPAPGRPPLADAPDGETPPSEAIPRDPSHDPASPASAHTSDATTGDDITTHASESATVDATAPSPVEADGSTEEEAGRPAIPTPQETTDATMTKPSHAPEESRATPSAREAHPTDLGRMARPNPEPRPKSSRPQPPVERAETGQEARKAHASGAPRQARPIALASPDGTARATSALRLPDDISHDVYCNDENLSKLCLLLPLEADYLALLDMAWREAANETPDPRATITFPLAIEDGTVIHISIRRRAPTPSGKRWELVAVHGERAA